MLRFSKAADFPGLIFHCRKTCFVDEQVEKDLVKQKGFLAAEYPFPMLRNAMIEALFM